MVLIKKDIYLYIIIILLYLVLIFKSLIFLILPVLVLFSYINKNITLIFMVIFFTLICSFNNYYVALQILIIFIYYCTVVVWLSENKERFLYINSIVFIFFVFIFFIFFDLFEGSVLDIFMFKERLWFVREGIDLNPNLLGVLAAVSFIGAYLNKSKFFSSISLYILLLTQSRAALLFLLVYLVFSSLKSFKNTIFIFILSMSLGLFIFMNESLNRLSDFSMNGRDERKYEALSLINKNFPNGYDMVEMKRFINNVGTVDNLYLSLILKWGVVGIVFLILFFLPVFKSNSIIKSIPVILSVLVYGFFEESFISNIMLLTFLGLFVFNSVDKVKLSV